MTSILTGSGGFIGGLLGEKLRGIGDGSTKFLQHKDIIHGHSYNSDRMFFLSTYGNMAHHDNHPMMINANVVNMLTVLNGFTGWFCYMSSSSVTLPVQTPYSRTKRAAEELLQALPALQSCIVRPFSVTGCGEQKEHLIPTLIRSCMEGEEMPFDPNPTHDFIDVEDVVFGLLHLASGKATGIFEFGNGQPISNDTVRGLVEEACGKKANIIISDKLRPYDNEDWYCRKPIFKPKKSLQQSISEMVEAYKRDR